MGVLRFDDLNAFSAFDLLLSLGSSVNRKLQAIFILLYCDLLFILSIAVGQKRILNPYLKNDKCAIYKAKMVLNGFDEHDIGVQHNGGTTNLSHLNVIEEIWDMWERTANCKYECL